ncbi:unnamed protein product [Symbiodinium natans]|uniref:Uncharacterized protein n=1 Tax=Symbiodinium natans TaxID=878477 RepID=A0A812NIG2_9DINO|nr:unnamed protein product [Symbiodinium natans]
MLTAPPLLGGHFGIARPPAGFLQGRDVSRKAGGCQQHGRPAEVAGGKSSKSPAARRQLCSAAGLLLAALGRPRRASAGITAPSANEKDLAQRLSEEASLRNPRLLWGADEVAAYPGWLFGEWEISSRPSAFREPLGSRFLDEATRSGIREDFEGNVPAKPLRWKSRFYWETLDRTGEIRPRARTFPGSGILLALPALAESCPAKVVQFRAYNAGQEMSAFLKQGVPRVVADADPREKPLQISVSFPVTVEEDEELIRSVVLKLEASRTQQVQEIEFISSELFRQTIFTDGELDSSGDFEVINAYSLIEPGRVAVRNRVAKYLIPSDDLYKEAAGQAVSWADYLWDLKRLSTCIDTPYGQQCVSSEAATARC